jgi:hypothetical protein
VGAGRCHRDCGGCYALSKDACGPDGDGRQRRRLACVPRRRVLSNLVAQASSPVLGAAPSPLDGIAWVMAMPRYGWSLQVVDCLRLHAKNVDFTRKGANDRVTMLWQSASVYTRAQAGAWRPEPCRPGCKAEGESGVTKRALRRITVPTMEFPGSATGQVNDGMHLAAAAKRSSNPSEGCLGCRFHSGAEMWFG